MTAHASPYLRGSRPNGDALPAPYAPNGAPLGPCHRPSCHAMQKHALRLARRIEELRLGGEALARERDALRVERDALRGAADWTPLGGERVLRSLTPTEARLCEALLLAGRDPSPDDGHDEPPAGEFRTARYRGILDHVWGPAWGIGDVSAEMHLIRVNVSRLRHKLRSFGWDAVAVTGWGLRLAPWTGERIPRPPDRPGLRHARVTDAERARVCALWEAGYRASYIATVTGRSADAIRRLLRVGVGHG